MKFTIIGIIISVFTANSALAIGGGGSNGGGNASAIPPIIKATTDFSGGGSIGFIGNPITK